MTTRTISTGVFLLLLLTVPGFSQQWSKYVPKKERKDILKRSMRGTGLGAIMAGHSTGAFWVTEPMARAAVSDLIDRERLTAEAADKKYAELRPENVYCFLINTARLPMLGGPVRASTLPDPLHRKEVFLQRAENRELFSKGNVSDHEFDIFLGGSSSSLLSTYVLILPKTDRDGQPIVRALTDKIELQFTLSNKKIILEFKLKDLVSSLNDL